MQKSLRFSRVLTLAAAVVAGLAAQAAQADGSYYSLGYGLKPSGASADGSVVSAYVSNDSYYVWTAAAGVTAIGGKWLGGTADVSANGSIISGSALGADGITHAAYYTVATGTWTTLSGLGRSIDGSESSAWGISGDGKTVVGLAWTTGVAANAVKSAPDNTLLNLGVSGRAQAVNYDASVIAGYVRQGLSSYGVYWQNGTMTKMTDAQGNLMPAVNGMSDDGTWLVGSSAANGQTWRYNTLTHAVEWLGDFDTATTVQASTGISADGKIIVGYDRDFNAPPSTGQGTIWIEGTGMLNLTDYVLAQGVDLNGRTLGLPLGVSDDGRTFYGIDNMGEGFVVTLSPVPEPATYATLALGLAAIAWRRRSNAASRG